MAGFVDLPVFGGLKRSLIRIKGLAHPYEFVFVNQAKTESHVTACDREGSKRENISVPGIWKIGTTAKWVGPQWRWKAGSRQS